MKGQVQLNVKPGSIQETELLLIVSLLYTLREFVYTYGIRKPDPKRRECFLHNFDLYISINLDATASSI